ncbi:hypothetical protein CANARDRAFT_29114 [[Candida] arabinofermentans NRRL YB-2248]|uniref:Inhibitor I9 domain-containing protein n=1 Tax=[Candida] arabinofermentans NRRL YB-2248 TaxID=983967 RepID=A0A1E4SYK1_9ASCO|nr:hypothetical protein CANARDRAFT_29114 [[Candida] arabinofermentans NRRL YB-2248]
MSSDHKTFIVTLKETCTDPAIAKFKSSLEALGGEIQHEYSLIKGFSVKLPSIHSQALQENDAVATVEEDQEVKTQ